MSNMDNILSNEIILVGDIVSYYIEKNEEYDFFNEDGLKKYIKDIPQ